jgi:hypothetical protein
METLATTDPEAILVIVPGVTGGPPIGAMVAGALPTLAAVQAGRVHEIDLEVYLQAPGPRAVEGLRPLAELLHPALAAPAELALNAGRGPADAGSGRRFGRRPQWAERHAEGLPGWQQTPAPGGPGSDAGHALRSRLRWRPACSSSPWRWRRAWVPSP